MIRIFKFFFFFVLFLNLACSTKKVSRSEPMDERASIQYQFAFEAYTRGELIPALQAALRAKEVAPRNADVMNLLGLIYFRQYKYSEAEETFKKAVDIDSSMSEIYNNLGTLYYEMKKYDEAFAMLEKALENPLYLHPERIHNNRGLVLEAQKKFPEAQAEYERAIALTPDFYLPYQNLGKLFFNQKQYDRAKNLLSHAAKLCQECSEPRYFLGSVYMKENKASEALKLFKQGADMDPQGYYGQLCKQFIVKP